MERFDAIVVGAGPAGSTAAHRLASAGASVLLADRARFPRDKPCGGGLTIRAARLLPFAVDPVVEDAAQRVEIRRALRHGFERGSAEPLVLLTRRARLDAFLAERAAAAGADFRDGARVTEVAIDGARVTATVAGRSVRAAALIGADGVNGTVARSLGLARELEHGVALEGNLSHDHVDASRYRGRLVLEFGTVPGGYGWVFPKGDHVNVGVGGWASEGPRLREHLGRFCAACGLPLGRLEQLRGYRLPLRRPAARLARGPAAVVGDAAGLVDPFSGDGIYEAFLSGGMASDAVLDLLAGRAASLEPYHAAVSGALAGLLSSSWALKHTMDRFPRLSLGIVRLPFFWPAIEAVVRGELAHPDAATGRARVHVALLRALARRTGRRARDFHAAPPPDRRSRTHHRLPWPLR